MNNNKENQSSDSTINQSNDVTTSDKTYEVKSVNVTEHVDETTTAQETQQTNILQYDNESPSLGLIKPSMQDHTFDYASFENNALVNALSRPVKLGQYTWTVGSDFDISIDPFDAWMANDLVKNKLTYYMLLRTDLELTFKINASPFHYGRLLFGYIPNDDNYSTLDTTIRRNKKILVSQRGTCVYLEPGKTDSVSLTVPYFRNSDYYNMARESGWSTNLTGIDIVPLRIATSTAPLNITVTIIARAINTELTVPIARDVFAASNETTNLKDTEASEQTSQGVISRPANAVSKFLGKFVDIPFIGDTAKTAAGVASGVSKIASLLGFSRPVMEAPNVSMRRFLFDRAANTSGGSAIEKLSYDVKQFTEIAPASFGLQDNMDEMSIAHIAGRPSYWFKSEWTAAQAPGTVLFSFNVTPTVAVFNAGTSADHLLTMTPMCFASLPFEYWGGSIIYKLNFVSSSYHRGRVRIIYAPDSNSTGISDLNKNYSMIVDITEKTEVAFVIGMAQDNPFRKILLDTEHVYYDNDGTNITDLNDSGNGCIYVEVLNELTSSDASANIEIVVSTHAAPDFNVFGSKSLGVSTTEVRLMNLAGEDTPTTFAPTVFPASNEETLIKNTADVANYLVGEDQTSEYEMRASIYHGDPIVTYRNYLKRWCDYEFRGVEITTPGGEDNFLYGLIRPNFPLLRGGVPNGTVGLSVNNMSYVQSTPIAYLARGYAAWRGNVKWRYSVDTMNATNATSLDGYAILSRFPDRPSSGIFESTAFCSNNDSGSYETSKRGGITPSGATLTRIRAQPVLEAELPWYCNKRFGTFMNASVPPSDVVEGDMFHRLFISGANVSGEIAKISYNSACAAGDNFALAWFRGAPQFYVYKTT